MHFSLNAQPVNFHSAACARARPQQFSWAHVLGSFCSADEMEISRGQNRIGETRLQPELEQHPAALSTQEEGKRPIARGGHRHEHPRMGLVLGGPVRTNSTEQSQHNTTQPQYGTRSSCSAAHFRRRCACAAPQSQNTRNDNIDSTSRFTGQYLARLRRTTYYLPAACSLQPSATVYLRSSRIHTYVYVAPRLALWQQAAAPVGVATHIHTYIPYTVYSSGYTPRSRSRSRSFKHHRGQDSTGTSTSN